MLKCKLMDQNKTMVIIRTMRHVLWTLVTKVMLNGHSWHIKCERYLRQFYVQKSPTQRPLPFSLFHFCTCVTWAVTSESKYDFTLFNCKMIHLNLAYIIWLRFGLRYVSCAVCILAFPLSNVVLSYIYSRCITFV